MLISSRVARLMYLSSYICFWTFGATDWTCGNMSAENWWCYKLQYHKVLFSLMTAGSLMLFASLTKSDWMISPWYITFFSMVLSWTNVGILGIIALSCPVFSFNSSNNCSLVKVDGALMLSCLVIFILVKCLFCIIGILCNCQCCYFSYWKHAFYEHAVLYDVEFLRC